MKKYIPNFFTFLNMASGLVALVMVFKYRLEMAAFFVFLGIAFDFLDGFFARILHVKSDLGLQLDSLADLITSGVVPGAVMYVLLQKSLIEQRFDGVEYVVFIPYLGFILTLAAGYRLAKFNLDTRQTERFIGLPTPAMSIFVVSLPLILLLDRFEMIRQLLDNPYVLLVIVLLFSYLMNSKLPLFALKFKNFSWQTNGLKYIFLLISLFALIFIKIMAIPLMVLFYIFLSLMSNLYHSSSKS